MNEQKPPGGIEWTRIRNADGTMRRGFTWNPVGGCLHGCQWQMPDGAVAECYAKLIAERAAQNHFRQGFEHHYWREHKLEEPLKVTEPAGIFLDSMSDLMGSWVPYEQIEAILRICSEAHWHIFQLLTKNAPRLTRWLFPDNVWVGVSSPPDWMHGKRLARAQQERMLRRSLETLANTSGGVRWMSFEPLSWHVATIVADYPGVLDWAVIGAASNGNAVYPPQTSHLEALLDVLDRQGVPVFFKGNLKHKPWAKANWREDFPDAPSVEIAPEDPVQLELL